MSDHIQHKNDILTNPKFFTPELMVASDLETNEIQHLSKKFFKCHEKQCYQKIYENSELIDYMRPPIQMKGFDNRQEL